MVWDAATSRCPLSCSLVAAASVIRASAAASTCRAASRIRSPSGVRRAPRGCRTSNLTPSCASRAARSLLALGCAIRSERAAAPMLP